MSTETNVSISVHLGESDRFVVAEYPDCPAGPFASLEVGGGVGLLAHNPERFRRLAVLALAAADWLVGLQEDGTAAEPAHLSVVTR